MSEYDTPGRELRTEGGGMLRVVVARPALRRSWRVRVYTADDAVVIDERCADRDEALMRADYWSERLSGGLKDT